MLSIQTQVNSSSSGRADVMQALAHSVMSPVEHLGPKYRVPSSYLWIGFPAVNHRCQDRGNKAPRAAQLFLMLC